MAVLLSVIGGCLLLPQITYDLSGWPDFTKNTAIALGLILGGRISGKRQAASFRWKLYDVPMLIWLICPLMTSSSNGLGIRDGLSSMWFQFIDWGVPYFSGRVYFDNLEKLRDLCLGLVIGGLLYMPLCLFEIRMSPQLNARLYGFFPHEWIQHVRYGGFRPIVFMQHGLMVSLWMAITTVIIFWLWRSSTVKHIKAVPISFLFFGMAATTVLCKSANGWFTLIIGCGSYFAFRWTRSTFVLRVFCLIIPVYIALRILGIVEGSTVESLASNFVDAERIGSLSIRLYQEDLFIKKTMENVLVGWGGYGRGWPVDLETGKNLIQMIDALWLIVFNTYGLIGISSLVMGLLLGPWMALRSFRKEEMTNIFPAILSLMVILFLIDCLVNGMTNMVYVLISGSVLGTFLHQRDSVVAKYKNRYF